MTPTGKPVNEHPAFGLIAMLVFPVNFYLIRAPSDATDDTPYRKGIAVLAEHASLHGNMSKAHGSQNSYEGSAVPLPSKVYDGLERNT